jgi:predicted ATPase/class 3 adenylate cyclase
VHVSAAAAPSGVVTFLFTDVEGSTRRWEADADAMGAALVAHDEVLHGAIEAHGGWLFKHTGDGVCAAFASPGSAVDAAIAAQRALELPVRMGIATGEAELRGADYLGAVLNRVARIMAAGHGGQILVAESTAVLLSGVDLLDLGPRRLRDVPTPVGVFQVRASGLRAEFPPLRALDPNPGNLRPQTTSFVGREAEVAEVTAAMRSHRLVTLSGVGGVGKTRLAIEVAAGLADEFPDGVWFFELAAVADPGAVPGAVATVLGVTQQPEKSVSESVAAALEGRVRLLVFDNCEHVRDAAADLVETILAHSATVKILATSREGLSVADEQLWLVPSLDVGAGVDSAAVRLFVERAQSVSSRFWAVRPDEAAAMVEICRRVDGIPLAIELAASRMASMTAIEVRDRLHQRFRLLVGSRRRLERHQTLRHAVAWSYDLLDDAERALLQRCSVFAGGFDLESACAIMGYPGTSDDLAVLDLLDALVRKSLLVADGSAGRTRYSMLETIRQFAEEQLAATGASTEVRGAHARYFAGREDDVMALWDSPRQREAYTWCAAEMPNLRTAFRWAADSGDLDTAATVATYATLLGYMVENFEAIAWAEELIEAARTVDHPRLAYLYSVASMCYNTGRVDDAVGYSDAGKKVIESGRYAVPFGIEAMLGTPWIVIGQSQRWVDLCRAELARGRDTHTLSWACLVFALVIAGRADEAMAAVDGLVDAAEITHNPGAHSFALLAEGFALRTADPMRALDALRRGFVIAQGSGNRLNESHYANILSELETEHGDPQAALDYLTLAIRNYHDSGNTAMVRSPLALLAVLFHRLGRAEPAATVAGFAINPLAAAAFPEINAAIAQMREVLGAQTHESLARKGVAMTTSAMVAFAYDEIDQARAALNAVAK